MTQRADTEATPSPLLLEATSAFMTGMHPAFCNQRTGESHLSQSVPGVPALEYGFAGLPDAWVVERDCQGNPVALHPDVVAGYWHDARFIALEQLAQMPLNA